jgi:hypothetical protein
MLRRWWVLALSTGILLAAGPAAAEVVGFLRLDVNVDGAEVLVDGVSVGRTPLAPLALPIGEHTLRVVHPERLPVEGTVTIRAGADTAQKVQLRAVARLTFDVRPEGAQILLDGDSLGYAPIPPIEVLPGTHDVVVQHPTHEGGRRMVHVEAGEERTITVALLSAGLAPGETVKLVEEKKPDPWYGPWAGTLMASGVILGASGGTLVALDEDAAGWTLFGVGGAALVTGIVFAAVEAGSGGPRTAVGPAVLPGGGAALTVAGEF